jgi:dihydrofolate synthase/folylpolyglutamate synthase
MPDLQTHAEIVAALTRRWPEHRVAPSLGRVQALTALLGDPQRSFRVIHVTGTNGKGSTAAMIESLLRSTGLRTGRFTSPHVTSVNERITIDGEPISDERFDDVWHEIAPLVALVDDQQIDGVAMTFFEIITCMAFAAFADAPVDVAVLEVGLGGTWDATNVADADVAVITPIDLDHTHLLGDTVAEIAAEKAGIIKPGAQAILAGQSLEAAQVLLAHCADVGALAQREGLDFGVLDRQLAVGGQLVRLNGAEGPVDDVFLPLHGAHQAANAAQALAAVEAFLGLKAVNPDLVREGFAQVRFPGRLELVRTGPSVVLDAAHNPHGARATAAAITEAFGFQPLVGVVAVMADKDARGLLEVFEEVMNAVVVTSVASTSRGLPADALGELAAEVFGPERVTVAPRLDDALETAVGLAEGEGAGAPGVLVTGSVVLVGEARSLLVTDQPLEPAAGSAGDPDDDWDDDFDEEDDAPGEEGEQENPYDGFAPGAGTR